MKKYLASFLLLLSLGTFSVMQVSALKWFWESSPIINQDPNKALNVTWLDGEPIRAGAYDMTNNPVDGEIQGIINQDQIETHEGALQATLKLIQIIINRSLGILGLVALIYLVYNGFMMLTANADSKQFDKGKSWIKTAVIALAGIGISWFVVSMILRIILQLTGIP